MAFNVTFLGTGTSQGVPVIGCHCDVCMSEDKRDNRLRSSVLISIENIRILIDAGPDFRQQMLRHHVTHLDAILLTHEHNDHVVGLDDIRPFNFKQGTEMPVFALPRVIEDIKSKFSYIFESYPYPGAPRVICKPIVGNNTYLFHQELSFTTINVMHGSLPILGYRFDDFAYITDASYIDEEALLLLQGLEILVINALQFRKHYSHFTFDEAVQIAETIGAKKTYLTHMSHEMGNFEHLLLKCPPNIYPAYDGLILHVNG